MLYNYVKKAKLYKTTPYLALALCIFRSPSDLAQF